MITKGIAEWKFFAADVKCVESVRAVRAMLQQIFLGFGEFLAALVLAEAVAASHNSSRLDGENQVIIILTVKHRHEPLFTGKALVDEQVFLVIC